MGKIIWLASYPKSGNTWFRIYLTNFLENGDAPSDINKIATHGLASDREMFDNFSPISSSDLTFDEIDRLRPDVYQEISDTADSILYVKVHDAFTRLPYGRELFPKSATKAVVYFVRNPLDIAISYAHHAAKSVDDIIESMIDSNLELGSQSHKLPDQLRHKLLDWSGHVKSWADEPVLNRHIMRYEEMVRNPTESFVAATKFLGLADDEERIAKAVRFSSFEQIRDQEQEKGFNERSLHQEIFFRKGQVGEWQNVLSAAQVNKIVESHREMMARFGYLDEQGRPVVG